MRDVAVMTLDPAKLDYSMFRDADLRNIVLQRSEILGDVRNSGKLIKAWKAGDDTALDVVIADKSLHLAERAVSALRDEFQHLRPHIDPLAPKRIADIGCGYAFFDIYAQHAYDADLLLVDIEQNERRHFGYEDQGAAYASLPVARDFLAANGVPPGRIATWNPQSEDAPEVEKVDLAISLLSCGFHYPVDMYMPFFRFGVRAGGWIILDLRAGQFSKIKRVLSLLGRMETIDIRHDRKRVILRKGAA